MLVPKAVNQGKTPPITSENLESLNKQTEDMKKTLEKHAFALNSLEFTIDTIRKEFVKIRKFIEDKIENDP